MAIKAFSFTCIRDILMVERLHKQFESIGIEHTMYVDEREVEMFSQKLPCKSRGVHHNGTNGFGRDGMYAKLECIKDMVNSTIEGDTILDCDSDVYFNNLNIPFDMVCKELEYKGFCDTQGYNKDYTHSCNGHNFLYFTGAIKSYNRDLAVKITTQPLAHLMEDLIFCNITPGEDGFQSYFYSLHGKFTNMLPKYSLAVQSKDYDNKTIDIIT